MPSLCGRRSFDRQEGPGEGRAMRGRSPFAGGHALPEQAASGILEDGIWIEPCPSGESLIDDVAGLAPPVPEREQGGQPEAGLRILCRLEEGSERVGGFPG